MGTERDVYFFPGNVFGINKDIASSGKFEAIHFNIQIAYQKYYTYFRGLGIKISLNDNPFVSAITCDM